MSVTGQGSLVDIAWEDYTNEVYETTIYFSFSDGTIVDHELVGLSIVKNIEYRDITGDGTDEVIIYSEVLNTIHDDYILIDFFKVGDDTITDISPFTDIPELSAEMEIVNDPSEEYTIVLRMESHGKTLGAVYTDAIMIVGYNKERWEIMPYNLTLHPRRHPATSTSRARSMKRSTPKHRIRPNRIPGMMQKEKMARQP